MAYNCPNCNHRLMWSELAPKFDCPSCAEALTSNSNTVANWAIGVVLTVVGVLVVLPPIALVFVLVLGVAAIWVVTESFTTVQRASTNAT
jgi:hypothetical protein